MTNEEIDERIRIMGEGCSNDEEIDGLTKIIRGLQAERAQTSGSDYARLPANVYVCETCGTGQGYIWPIASDGMDDHYYIERCDMCERFASDVAAADYVAGMLEKTGFRFDRGDKTPGNRAPFPFIENIEDA